MIGVGSNVRSFDFPMGGYGRMLSGDRACFVDGVVTEINSGCYAIEVNRRVFAGREYILGLEYNEPLVYAPINGSRNSSGALNDYVEEL